MTAPEPSVLFELAARCERATGPDRELDALIYRLDPVIEQCWPHWSPKQRDEIVPRYTAAINTAMLLKLDWMSIETCQSAAPASSPELQFTRCRIWDWRRGPLAIDRTNEWKSEGSRPLPLNICAASLRALASIKA